MNMITKFYSAMNFIAHRKLEKLSHNQSKMNMSWY